jgi:UDP-N-acetylglucosamine 2-epimerase (non-hydrolysing)
MKILSVVGARPNFMKIAPLAKAFRADRDVDHVIVHTGQHYDEKMSASFFRQLGIPRPAINLEVGSGSHAAQTAEIMRRFEPVCRKHKPDAVLVVGDVNSTLACAVVAKKLWVPVVHVEAGLRSFDRRMPEEINRIVTDSICDVFFTTSPEAETCLRSEGVPGGRIFYVGNVMIDTLLENAPRAKKSKISGKLGLTKGGYALVTLHRPSNVDTKEALSGIMRALRSIQDQIPVVFPVHPRTMKNIRKFIPGRDLAALNNIRFIEPLGYFDFLNLMMTARFVLTDSGGIQEETTALGVPCLTARENTERPVTITEGTNVLVGTTARKIILEADKILAGKAKKGGRPKYWDGKASGRILKILKNLHRRRKLERCA